MGEAFVFCFLIFFFLFGFLFPFFEQGAGDFFSLFMIPPCVDRQITDLPAWLL